MSEVSKTSKTLEQTIDAELEMSLSLPERYNNEPFSTLETYKFFNQAGESLEEGNAKFINAVMHGDTMDAPTFAYDGIDVEELLRHRDSMTELLQAIPTYREVTPIERITRENIINRLDEIGLLLLTKMQSEVSDESDTYEMVSFQLGQNMREIYGTPDATHFRGVLGYRLAQLSKVEQMQDVPLSVREAWDFVKKSFPTDLPIEKPYEMKSETMQWYKSELEKRLEGARVAVNEAIERGEIDIDTDDKLDAENIVKACKLALNARGFSDWTAALTDESGIDTTQSKKTIFIPETRFMTLDEFDQIIQSHEIDEHVARRENGDNSGIEALSGTGAHGYLAFEEGNGKVNEGLLKGKVNNESSAFGYFLSGGIALGQDRNNLGRNFRETAELVWRMNLVDSYISKTRVGSLDDMRDQVAKTTTHLRRLFRGTDGKAPGVVFTKDAMTYYLGGVEVMRKWDSDMELSAEDRLKAHRVERAAKINPLRSDHVALVRAQLEDNPYEVR